MDLSAIQALPTLDKLQWLQSSDGLSQLQRCFSEGLSLHKVASQLLLSRSTLYDVCDRTPELAEITGRTLCSRAQATLTSPPAYCIVAAGLTATQHTRGVILCEFATADELWQSSFICHYFSSYGKDARDYYDSYIKALGNTGMYRLSNSYSLVYGQATKRDKLKILIPPL